MGFDSAWSPANRGAIAALRLEPDGATHAFGPERASFSEAEALVGAWSSGCDLLLVAIDQPTRVPNATGSRPVEGALRPVIGWLGSAIQPASRARADLFGDHAPIWGFLERLALAHDPVAARGASSGRFAVEVYPTVAAPAIDPTFFGPKRRARVNPTRKTFALADWQRLATALAERLAAEGASDHARHAAALADIVRPRKAHQDALDALICLWIALRHRKGATWMAGDTERGFIVGPAMPALEAKIAEAAAARGVPFAARADL